MKYIKIFEDFKLAFVDIDYISYIIRVDKSKIKINIDGTIDVDGDVILDLSHNNSIPFRFGKVTGNFECYSCGLTSLEGAPRLVGGNFKCGNNRLENLKFSPIEVGGNFDCYDNLLDTVYGMPLEIEGDFICYYNSDLRELDSVSNIEGFIRCDKKLDTSKFRGYCKEIKRV